MVTVVRIEIRKEDEQTGRAYDLIAPSMFVAEATFDKIKKMVRG